MDSIQIFIHNQMWEFTETQLEDGTFRNWIEQKVGIDNMTDEECAWKFSTFNFCIEELKNTYGNSAVRVETQED